MCGSDKRVGHHLRKTSAMHVMLNLVCVSSKGVISSYIQIRFVAAHWTFCNIFTSENIILQSI